MTEDEAWDELERKQAKKWNTSDMAHRSGGLSVEQEPVAAVELITIGSEQVIAVAWYDSNAFKVGTKLYTAPPKCEWVGLDVDDIDTIQVNVLGGGWGLELTNFARAIEAKLREKNT
jgi:hypothetical protein